MEHSSVRSTYLFSLGYLLFMVADGALLGRANGQSALSPPKIREQQGSNQSYLGCIRTAADAAKAGKLSPEQLSVASSRCGEKFPAVALTNECKKKILRNGKGKGLSELDFSPCQKLQEAIEFNPKAKVPIYVTQSQAFFAGVGLNRMLLQNDMQPPNFTCERYLESLTDIPTKAHHILFGNHPKMFSSGADQGKYLDVLAAQTGKPLKGKVFIDVPQFGRVFGNPLSDKAMVYFPSAACDFKGVTGDVLSGVSIYYMPDIEARRAVPYFGIAYYKPKQKEITTPELVAEITSRLGKDFKAYSKDQTTIFISAAPFQEVDLERDPRNICRTPRQHQFVAVIRTLPTSVNVPEYLLLANIRNLCDHGDRLAGRLAQSVR